VDEKILRKSVDLSRQADEDDENLVQQFSNRELDEGESINVSQQKSFQQHSGPRHHGGR